MRPGALEDTRLRKRRARMPQIQRSGVGSTLGSSPLSALTGLGEPGVELECRSPVAFGSLRPALLSHGWPRRPSESGQITCQNRADISLVFNTSLLGAAHPGRSPTPGGSRTGSLALRGRMPGPGPVIPKARVMGRSPGVEVERRVGPGTIDLVRGGTRDRRPAQEDTAAVATGGEVIDRARENKDQLGLDGQLLDQAGGWSRARPGDLASRTPETCTVSPRLAPRAGRRSRRPAR
jgi:hypothetical protein